MRTFFLKTLAVATLMLTSATTAGAQGPWNCGAEGSNVTATLSGGTLTINGNGNMANYDRIVSDDTFVSTAPWYENRSSITDVVIENNVTSVGNYAFFKHNLTSVVIPNSVLSIGNSAFSISGLTSITIPNGVTSIGNDAFSGCTYLTSITIPEGVTSIGDWAFSWCSGLTSITIPDGVTSIGNSVFYGCWGLTSITIPEGVTSIGRNAFGNCSGLTSITIPEGMTSIGESAFSGCSGLTSITIPEGMTSIGESAFSGCSGLTSITIPDNVTSIGSGWFANCSGLTSITIPEGVTSIGESAFSGCSGLTSITIPDGVTFIGKSAFSSCSGLTSITIPDGVTSIGDEVFNSCTKLTSITIPDGVTSIGESAFSGCSGLTSITIPDGVTSIGEGAFSDCSGLTSITIPDGVTSIGFETFSGCSGLTSITIPDGVTSIGQWAFSGCSGLTSITIPDGVTSIGWSAFEDCDNLKTIIFECETPPTIGNLAFQGVTGASFYVPNAGLESYRNVAALSGFSNILPTEPVVTFDRNYSTSDEVPSQQTVTNGEHATEPVPPPSRDGYDLDGWYKELECINKWDFGTDDVTDNITLYAKWDTIQYSITYNGIDGATVLHANPFNYNVETETFTLNPPTKVDSTFIGWTGTGIPDEDTLQTKEITKGTIGHLVYTAQWKIKTYTVIFESNGGDEVNPIENVEHGKLITKPANPERNDDEFDGWYKEPELENEWDFVTDVVTSERTLYAKWKTSTYTGSHTITFDAKNGTTTTTNMTDVNGKLESLPEPTKEGYEFDGWYTTEETGGTQVTGEYTFTGDATIYARWKELYAVTVNGGTSNPSSAVAGATVTITADEAPNNQVFDRWTTSNSSVTFDNENSSSTTFVMPANTVTVEATYKNIPVNSNAINVTIVGNGTASANKTSAEQDDEITLTATPSTGYLFDTWQVVSGGEITFSPNATTTPATFTMPGNAVTVKATFVALVHAEKPEISTEPQDGTAIVGETHPLTVGANNVTDGGTLSYQWYSSSGPTNNTSGTVMSGATGTTYSASNSVAGTYYYYVIVTNTNSSVNGNQTATDTSRVATLTVSPAGAAMYTVNVTNGTGSGDYAESAPVTITAPSLANQRFESWTITPSVTFTSGTNANTNPATFTMPAVTVIATAVYEPTYTLTVVGGSGSGNSYIAGEVVDIMADAGESGKQFKNWTSSAGGIFADANNATTTFTMPAGNVTVTAIYEYSITVTVEGDNTAAANPSVLSATQGTPITLTATAGDESRFVRWQVVSGSISLSSTTTPTATFNMPNSVVEVKAVFELIRPNITVHPQDATVTVGTTHSLTVTATFPGNGTPAYQWYRNTTKSNDGGTPISGATGPAYFPPTVDDGIVYYYVEVTNTITDNGGTKMAKAKSNVAEFTVQEYQPFYVIFYLNDGKPIVSEEYWDIRPTDQNGKLADLPIPTRDGYYFNGWFTSPVGGDEITSGWIHKKSILVYAQWTPSYKITFDANGGAVMPATAVTGEGRKLSSLPEPDERDGYKFDAWYTSATGGTKVVESRVYSNHTTIFARWKLESYGITYTDDGSPRTNPESYNVEALPITLKVPTKAGYTFAGWTGTDIANPRPTVTIVAGTTGDLVYTATWTPMVPVYTITFNPAGGMVTPGFGTTSNRRLTVLPEPAKADSAFIGWYTDVTGGELVTTSTEFDGDGAIYARWGTSYKVVFNANGGTVTPALGRTGVGGQLTSLPVPVRSGFTFTGWFSAVIDGMEIKANSTSFNSDNTIYARWVAVYTITFSPNGGTVTPTSCVTVVDGKLGCTLPEPKRDGYSFDGWFTSATGGEAVAGDRVYGANATVYARWTLITYTISFDPNGGTVSTPTGVTGAAWRLASLPTPKRDGWDFDGWFTAVDDGERVTTSTVFRADSTIYAQWTLITYRVTFDANGGSVLPAQGTTGEGGRLESLPDPERPGYIFDGWYMALTGGEELTTGTAFTVNTTIYARWTLIVYKISFNANGGVVSTAAGETGVGGRLASLPDPESWPGWAFSGWFTARTGGEEVTTGTVFTADAVIYAQWSPVYVVTFNATGGTVSPARDSTRAGGRLASMPVPKKDGYTFDGWFSADSGDGTVVTSSTVFTASDTVYARWSVSAPVPVVTAQPQSGVVAVGESGATVALTVSASAGGGGALSYQWYKNTVAGYIDGMAILGADGASYPAPIDVAGTFYYYVIVTNTIPDNGDGGKKTAEFVSGVAAIRVEDPNAVLSHDRAVPAGNTGDVAVVAPVGQLTAVFSAGPNPVSRGGSQPAVMFFRQGKRIDSGDLAIYDASGNFIQKVQIADKAVGSVAKRLVGSWGLADAKGRPVAAGTYLVRGEVRAADGSRERVSLMVGVR